MHRIKLSTCSPGWPFLRQTPGSAGVWGDCRFTVDGADDECDTWVVYEGLPAEATARVSPSRIIFVTGEPPMIRSYEPAFLAQFAIVLTCQRAIPGAVYRQQGLPWHIGIRRGQGGGATAGDRDETRFAFDDFKRMGIPEKTRDLSVICSAKSNLPGHQQRIAFVQALKNHFGERLDWFGRGFTPVDDKWDAIAPYRFHIALENSRVPDYWTEKLADSYLGGAYPIYFGCPNATDYFSGDSFSAVDLAEPGAAIATIVRLLGEGITPVRRSAIETAQAHILDEYNLFPVLAQLKSECRESEPRSVTLKPEAAFARKPSLFARVKRKVRKLVG